MGRVIHVVVAIACVYSTMIQYNIDYYFFTSPNDCLLTDIALLLPSPVPAL